MTYGLKTIIKTRPRNGTEKDRRQQLSGSKYRKKVKTGKRRGLASA